MDSSYDRSGGNGDADHYLSKTGNRVVLSDIRGPGCIYRFWSANAAGHLYIYFDGESKPTIDCPMQDFFLARVAPFVQPIVGHRSGGWYSYFPMPFQKSCRIEVTDPGGMYYHVQYQLYPDGTPIRTFTRELSSEDKSALDTIVGQWNGAGIDPKPDDAANPEVAIQGTFGLNAGSSKSFANIKGSGEISSIHMKIMPADRLSLRQTLLRVTWDDAKKPAIESPVGDFFGIGFGDHRFKSLPTAMTDNEYVCYWPMPFAKGAKFQLVNLGTEALKSVSWTVQYKKLKKPLENVGYFHAQWHRQTTVNGEHYHILHAVGRGLYVGEHTDMQGDRGIGFLEGDEKLYADGEQFPAIHGTGTEDFYTGGWYFDEGPFNRAYHGCTVKSDEFSRVSAYRYQIQDCVPFQKELYVDIEHGGTNDYPGADYSSVAYWYLDSPVHDWSPIDPKQLTPAVIKVNGVLEAEGLNWTGAGAKAISDSNLVAEASGGKLVAVKDKATFHFSAPGDDYYHLRLNAIALADSPASVTVTIDGNPVTYGKFGDPVASAGKHFEADGVVHLKPGDHTAEIDVEAGKTLYLDYVKLDPSPKEKGVVEAESLLGKAETSGGAAAVVGPIMDLSGYAALKWTPTGVGSSIKFPISVPIDAEYTLDIGVAKSPGTPKISASIDGVDAFKDVSTADNSSSGRKGVRLGDSLALKAGVHSVVLTVAGLEPGSAGSGLILDYIKLNRSRYPFSFEAESLKILDHKDGDVSTQGMAEFGSGWSGDAQLWLTGNKKGAEVSVELPVQKAGRFTLVGYYTTAGDYGTVQCLVDGKEVGAPTDCYSTGVLPKGRTVLGEVELSAGAHRITFRAVDKNAASSNYLIGIDAIGVEPVK